MGTKYLQFEDKTQAVDVLIAHGYKLSDAQDHFIGNGWGTLFPIPDQEGYFANIYDCTSSDLSAYEIVVNNPPYNVVAVKQDY
jgi:hypothetical protein